MGNSSQSKLEEYYTKQAQQEFMAKLNAGEMTAEQYAIAVRERVKDWQSYDKYEEAVGIV